MGAIQRVGQDFPAPMVAGVVVEEGVIVEDVNPGSHLAVASPSRDRGNILALLLENTTSADTRRTYETGWKAFFGESERLKELWISDKSEAVATFCSWPPEEQRLEAWQFQGRMQKQGKSPATINVRASAVRSLLKLAHSLGWSQSDGSGLFPKVTVQKYRDTRGIPWEKAKQLVKLPAQVHAIEPEDTPDTQKNKRLLMLRDTAMLNLFVQNGIRNSSLVKLIVKDFELAELGLWVIEKRKGGQKRRLTISAGLAEHIEAYLRYRRKLNGKKDEPTDALFQSAHRGEPWKGSALSRNGVRAIVKEYGLELGLSRGLFPHALRHTAISKLGKETKGDVIAMQEFSGHADVNTLMIYARQARDRQGELSNTLSKLLD